MGVRVTEVHDDVSAKKGEKKIFLVTYNSYALVLSSSSESVNHCSRQWKRAGPKNLVQRIHYILHWDHMGAGFWAEGALVQRVKPCIIFNMTGSQSQSYHAPR